MESSSERVPPASESSRDPAPVAEGPSRTEILCEKLLKEVRSSPQVLREVVHRPEETVTSLREACRVLAQRERALRALISAEDTKRLEAERDHLASRVQAEKDDVVHQRLAAALASLDDQLRQRARLVTAAARLEAEQTRIHYALENLYTQVIAVKSADAASADVAGTGLRQSLARLGDEVNAVAESLEAVNRGEESLPSPVTPISSGDENGRTAPNRERSK